MFRFSALIVMTLCLAAAELSGNPEEQTSMSWKPFSWLGYHCRQSEKAYQADWSEQDYVTYESKKETQKQLLQYQIRIAVLEQQLNASNERLLAESKAHEGSRYFLIEQAKSQAQITELKVQLAERDLADCRTQSNKPLNKTIPNSVARTFEYMGHKLALFQKVATWSQAVATCHEHGWTLLSVENQHKQDAVLQIRTIAGEFNHWHWMSGNSLSSKGSHVWQSSGRPFCFTNWAQGQPEKEEELRCVYTRGISAQWYSGICHGTAYFICEDSV